MAFKKMKRWLERMAEQNDKRYGNQKLDCCGMNRQELNPARKEKTPPAADKTCGNC